MNELSTRELLVGIHDALVAQNRDSNLWTRHEIAEYCNLAPATVSKSIICKPSFPKPVRIPEVGSRWYPNEVKEWVKKHRGERIKRAGRPRKN